MPEVDGCPRRQCVRLLFRSRARRFPVAAPAGGRAILTLLEGSRKVARREESRLLGNLEDGQFGRVEHLPFGVFDAQFRDPVAEREVVGRLDVSREVGAVGVQRVGQLLDGEPRTDVSVAGDPLRKPGGDIAVGGRCLVVRRVGELAGDRPLRGDLLLERLLDPLVEEQVVQVGAVEVDVEGDRREDPQEDVAVGQEGEQPAADA